MDTVFTHISQIPVSYTYLWNLLYFIFKLLGTRGEMMREKLKAPILIFTPYEDTIPWVRNLFQTQSTQIHPPYFGGTPIYERRYEEIEQRHFIYLKIKNEPKFIGKNSVAKNVFAKLTFYALKSNLELLSERYGRWSESMQPPQVFDTEKLKYIDIPANDKKHWILHPNI